MGEYFKWMNRGKGQRLDEGACDDFSWMLGIATIQRCDLTEAACTLINGPWHGDRVIFAGDYLAFGEGRYESRDKRLATAFGRYPWETCCGDEPEVIPAPDTVVRYRYAINDTKREFVDRDATPLASVCELPNGELDWSRYDPVPALFSPAWYDDPARGCWSKLSIRVLRGGAQAATYSDERYIPVLHASGEPVLRPQECSEG